MSRRYRLAMIAIAMLIAVVAFVVLRGQGDDSKDSPSASNTATSPATQDGTTTQRPSKPAVPLLEAGEVQRLKFTRGDEVTFEVRSATAEEVHVHGYDILRDVPAGKTVTVSFPAEIEGIFEIELEGSTTKLADLEVRP